MFTFNAYPPPKPGESSRGYFLRLVDLNGYKNVENVSRKIGVKYAFKSHPKTRQWLALLNKLAPAISADVDSLTANIKAHWASWLYSGFDMSVSNLFHHNARVCPKCLDDEAYLRADWDFSLNVVCLKHQCLLIEECSECYEPIDWNRAEVCYCYKCGADLRLQKVNTIEANHALMRLTRKLPNANREYIEDLITAYKRILRPKDNMLGNPPVHMWTIQNAANLLEAAYTLLHSPTYRAGYAAWLRVTRKELSKLSRKAVEEPLNYFLASLNHKPVSEKLPLKFGEPIKWNDSVKVRDINNPIDIGHRWGIQAARFKNPHPSLRTINLSSQINHERLAVILNVPSVAIKHVIDHGALIPMNEVDTIRHTLIDLNKLVELFSSLCVRAKDVDSDFISLSKLGKEKPLSLFAVPFYKVIELIIEQELPIYIEAEEDGIFDGYVKKGELYSLLNIYLYNKAKRLNILTLAKVLNVPPSCIHHLIELGILNAKCNFQEKTSNLRQVDEYPLAQFFQNYACLNREAFLLGLNSVAAHNALARHKIEPSLKFTIDKRTMYLYQNTSDFRTTLAEIASYKR